MSKQSAFGRVPLDLVRSGALRDLDRGALAVVLVVAGHVNGKTGTARLRLARLAELTGLSERGVRKAVGRAEGSGVLAVQRIRGRGKTNVYRLAVPAEKPELQSSAFRGKKTGTGATLKPELQSSPLQSKNRVGLPGDVSPLSPESVTTSPGSPGGGRRTKKPAQRKPKTDGPDALQRVEDFKPIEQALRERGVEAPGVFLEFFLNTRATLELVNGCQGTNGVLVNNIRRALGALEQTKRREEAQKAARYREQTEYERAVLTDRVVGTINLFEKREVALLEATEARRNGKGERLYLTDPLPALRVKATRKPAKAGSQMRLSLPKDCGTKPKDLKPDVRTAIRVGGSVMKAIRRDLGEITNRLDKVAKTSDCLAFAHVQGMRADLDAARRMIRAVTPHAPCPYCQQTGKRGRRCPCGGVGCTHCRTTPADDTCPACKGGGWVTRAVWDTAPRDLRGVA